MAEADVSLERCGQSRGRALFISKSGALYIARGYAVYRSDDSGQTWSLDCRVPWKGWKSLASMITIGARLLRFYIQAFQVLQDGSRVAVARDGIYRAEMGQVEMHRTWLVTRGSRPISLSGDGDRVLFGEYGGEELNSVQVRVYCSEDRGEHFEPVYEFPKGDIQHVHNVVVDNYANHYWVLAGDHGKRPGIGVLSKDRLHFDWVERGSQMVRAVNVLVRPDCLIYGSDSELEHNHIVRLDKKKGRHERVMPIDGSSLYAADFGEMSLISTCVESSRVNKGKHASLYLGIEDENWSRTLSYRKDCWNGGIFQFGLIVLPHVQSRKPVFGMFSGQALANQHDRVSIFGIPCDK